MRLVFAGTPEAAVPTLRRLHEHHDVVAVVTRPDAPLGRRRVLTPSPVAAAAAELGLPLLKTVRLDDDTTDHLAALNPDLGVIVAYGGLVRERLLAVPEHGWINLHFSILPAWRGAAPVQRALIAGDEELGASVFALVPELDAGDVFATQTVAVPPEATAGEALATLAEAGAPLTLSVVDQIADGSAVSVPQRGAPTYAAKLSREDGRIDWSAPLNAVYGRFRGVTPEPGAFTTVSDAALKLLAARAATGEPRLAPGVVRAGDGEILIGTGTDPLAVSRLQPAGRGPMSAADWLRGQRGEVRVG